jgi:hypothetical protein
MPGASILIHGINNTGKTVLAAAALKYFSQFGKVSFASLDEEQGHSSAAGMGLDKDDLGYQCLYEVSTYDEYVEWLTMIEKDKYIATTTDSLWALYRLIQKKKTGGLRPPKAGKSDDNEWPWIHNDAHNLMTRWRKSATWNIMTCPSDTGQNALKEVESGIKTNDLMVCPDLNGKLATGCVHWFNLVGYLVCDAIKQGNKTTLKRTLSFLPSKNYVSRQRMPYGGLITDLIQIPEGNPQEGWETLINKANEAYKRAYTAKIEGAT